MKQRGWCFLCKRKDHLTKHHIVPKRLYNYYWNAPENMLVLGKNGETMCHDIIECARKDRTWEFYRKHRGKINKYNAYIKAKGFDSDRRWRVLQKRKL